MHLLRQVLKIAVPIVVLGAGAMLTRALILSYENPEPLPIDVQPPLVRVVAAKPANLQLKVRAEGTVVPRTESQLVPEISGRVVEVSPSLAAGGFFNKGDTLLRFEAREYELAVTRAKAAIEQARLRLAVEENESRVAREEWQAVGEGEPSPLLFREPQIAEVQASMAASEAALQQAEYDLERTALRAPFAGRVRSKQVDMGQFVQRGMPVATIYSVDVAEVKLPIPNAELEYCRLPMAYRDGTATAPEPAVRLTARFAGREHSWQGRIVRTEGEIDPRTRMVNAVAQVQDPYARGRSAGRPPLAVGMFVRAEIDGIWVSGVVSVPREAMRNEDTVYIVDGLGRLSFRQVDVLRRERDNVLIRGGIEEGELICLSTLELAVNGMQVQVIEESTDGEAEAVDSAGAP